MSLNKKLNKYLKTRATTSPWQLSGSETKNSKAAIIIPALAESNTLPKTLASLATNPPEQLQQTQIVIVINNRPTATDEEKSDNQATLRWLQDNPYPQLNLNWVDASSPGYEIPCKEGVGFARKIGFDLALQQLDWSREPLLISLDADTLVDRDYLPAISCHFASSKCGAAVLPFRHQAAEDPQQEAAIRQYELYLRSYLFGLQQAGSPYAYHSIGSAFACRADAYVAAGGMNRRQAAEDFYFLQQLAKTSGVEMLCGTVVGPSPRFSGRVPFGTGKAVQGQVEEGVASFCFSTAQAFQLLQQWVQLVENSLDKTAEQLLAATENISPVLHGFLQELKFAKSWSGLQNNHRTREQRLQAFHSWFDALRTRQLLTRLDAGRHQTTAQIVSELLEWGGYPGVTEESAQLVLLEELQQAVK
ncbi:Glycosyltransferase like family 2 [Malonomonas rubra DSM 5091]|uniref:Glycosyltransferase like family 2 n=1 Tax=Malonomonas rubra DSM 5091 TaxID=1122189 RepID=A0A1M6GB72_MALRU|nr:glycosyltransferase [Malonomonas rubra]SHJ07127.1 Glycosyltransferase like family 2 [Malonomonas rubra DSM 5091]